VVDFGSAKFERVLAADTEGETKTITDEGTIRIRFSICRPGAQAVGRNYRTLSSQQSDNRADARNRQESISLLYSSRSG
jgi:hypothetical protein